MCQLQLTTQQDWRAQEQDKNKTEMEGGSNGNGKTQEPAASFNTNWNLKDAAFEHQVEEHSRRKVECAREMHDAAWT